MAAYQKRQYTIFSTVHSEGAILPMDLLLRISDPQNAQLDGLTPEAYHLSAIKLNEAVNQAWTRVLGTWQRFRSEQDRLDRLSPHESGTTLTRERWLLPLFSELGYGRLLPAKALVIDERSYAISHNWQHTPIHLVSYRVDLDRSVHGENGARRNSPHSLLQELLNRSTEHLWGIVSNGQRLRILRNNISLTRQAYVEFDLEAMFTNEIYADFVLLWLLCHQSRVESERPEECWLEKWSREAHATGTRALEQLRVGVERAISELGSGFLSHPANGQLREQLRAGTLSAMDYYNQLLRLVYRLLVLFVAEDRDILFHPDAPPEMRNLYNQYYSTAKLRYQADRQLGTHHADLFYGLKLVMEKLEEANGCPELGLPGLNGFLFSREAIADLADCQLANYALLAAVRYLAYTESGRTRRIIDYKNLGSEELGSVYESLLELHPIFHLETGTFELASASGNERKTTGSYYTPTSLITSLLDSALDPVLAEAANQATAAEAEAAILNLKICDPACGSGHFLVAAAHRVAKRLAAMRTGDEEPTPEALRTALRDVVGRCIYGVDINPMAVELCKVSLWMEAIVPGKPLSFLDAHIQCGNSLLSATPALLKAGIPDEAFEPIEGDDKKVCSDLKKLNKKFREGNRTLRSGEGRVLGYHSTLRADVTRLDNMDDTNVQNVREKQQYYDRHQKSAAYRHSKVWADAWCAAFIWEKVKGTLYPFTEDDFRALDDGIENIDEAQIKEIQRLAKQYQFFHWHLAFPDVFRVPGKNEEAENEQAGWSGGFDVVLGNPPWERFKLPEKEWFSARRPDIANASNATQRKHMIEKLIQEDTELYAKFLEDQRKAACISQLIRGTGRYPLCGQGEVNTYAIFAEDMRWIVSATGRIGCIVPSGIATDETTKYFFQDLTESQTLDSLYSFENEEFIFPAIHHATKFCLLTITGSKRTLQTAKFMFFARQTSYLQDELRIFTLSASDIRLFNPNTRTCPIFRSQRDMVLTKAIYQRAPIFIEEGVIEENPWNVTLRQGVFNMTRDSHLFRTSEQLEMDGWLFQGNAFHKNGEVCQPLYEGKMVWHFDHRFGTYAGQTEAQARQGKLPELSEEEHADPQQFSLPQYWIQEKHFPELMKNRHAFLTFRSITSASVLRTTVFSLMPVLPCGNSLSIVLADFKYKQELAFLAANLSAFALDYVARQKVGGSNLNFFIINQFPVFPPRHYKTSCAWDSTSTIGDWILPRTLELTYTAWDLEAFAKDCGYAGPPFRWDEERRFLLRCELDAAYFHLYGIERGDVDYIMDTFRVWKEKEEKQYGEYRTKRVILEIYDEMRRALETGMAYGTRLVPGPADVTVAHEGK